MKKFYYLSLAIFTIFFRIESYSQCNLSLVRQPIQSGFSDQTSYSGLNNTVHTVSKKDTVGGSYFTFHVFEDNQWKTLSRFKSTSYTKHLMKWNDRYICFGDIASFNGQQPPANTLFGLLQYENGVWDTLPGSLIPNTTYSYNCFAVGSELYCSYMGTTDKKVFKYDTSTQKFNHIFSFEPDAIAQFLPTRDRFYITNIKSIDGRTTNGFAYYLNDSIITINDTFFKTNAVGFSYAVNKDSNILIGTNYKNPSDVTTKYFKDSVIRTRKSSFIMPPNISSFGYMGYAAKDNLILWVSDNFSTYRYYIYLCGSSNTWRHIALKLGEWGNLFTYKDTFYITNNKNHINYILGNGIVANGKLFIDFNENCNLDSGDIKLPEHLIEFKSLSSGSRLFFNSDTGANFNATLDIDTFVLKGPSAFTDCSTDTMYLNKDTVIQNLSLKEPIGIHFESDFLNANRIRWNGKSTVRNFFRNYGGKLDSLIYVIKFSKGIFIDTCDHPSDLINDSTIRVRLYNLDYFEKRNFKLVLSHDTSIYKLGDTCFGFCRTVGFQGTDSLVKNDSNKYRFVYSYDPNYKSVKRNSIPVLKDTRINYMIEFQNEGNDDAHDVTIIDTLPHSLNPSTFRILEASHKFEASLNGRVLKFVFHDIYLKPKSENEEKSKGFVTFKIDNFYGVKNGDSIVNRAFIYFDLNKPIITNYAVVKISENTVSVKDEEFEKTETLMVYPNPGNSSISVHSKEPVYIYNSMGQLLYNPITVEDYLTINIESWPTGIYIFRNGSSSIKFVKTD